MQIKIAIKNIGKEFPKYKNFFLKEKQITENKKITIGFTYFYGYIFNIEININLFSKVYEQSDINLCFFGYTMRTVLSDQRRIDYFMKNLSE